MHIVAVVGGEGEVVSVAFVAGELEGTRLGAFEPLSNAKSAERCTNAANAERPTPDAAGISTTDGGPRFAIQASPLPSLNPQPVTVIPSRGHRNCTGAIPELQAQG